MKDIVYCQKLCHEPGNGHCLSLTTKEQMQANQRTLFILLINQCPALWASAGKEKNVLAQLRGKNLRKTFHCLPECMNLFKNNSQLQLSLHFTSLRRPNPPHKPATTCSDVVSTSVWKCPHERAHIKQWYARPCQQQLHKHLWTTSKDIFIALSCFYTNAPTTATTICQWLWVTIL